MRASLWAHLPFGQVRTDVGNISQTDFGYTGQRANSYIKLLDYKSRWYDPDLGRFVSPDSIVPDAANPQSWNRFSYVENNPILNTDPTGHVIPCLPAGCGGNNQLGDVLVVVAAVGAGALTIGSMPAWVPVALAGVVVIGLVAQMTKSIQNPGNTLENNFRGGLNSEQQF